MPSANEPLIIVGAGIAGLATALALTRAGHRVEIIEHRPGPVAEGAGLQIGPNGTRILDRLGLLEVLTPHAGVPAGIDVRRGETGRSLTQLPLGDWIKARHGSPYWVLHRADLADALLTAVQAAGVPVRYGVAGDTLANDMPAIGADGVWSYLRRSRFSASEPTFTGRVALRTRLPRADADPLFHQNVTVWMAACAHVVTYPIQAGREINVVVLVPGDDTGTQWSAPVTRADVATRTSAFAYDLRRLLTTAKDWRQWPLVESAPLPSYASGTTALVGDAAHPMLPFLAQGAVMALEDAVALADAVTVHQNDLASAFKAYSDSRLARTQRVVSTAAANGRLYHLAGIAAAARDTALMVAPPSVVMARYDWLYGGP